MQSNSVRDYLQHHRASVLDTWLRRIRETYPEDTARFLREEPDRFINPVGHVISREIKTLYDELLHDMNTARLAASVEEIMRIRAVQEFSASGATGIVFLLKQAVREALAGELDGASGYAELLEFESRIDTLALLAFDSYTKCRERITDLRVREAAQERDMALRLMARTGGIAGMGDGE